MSEQEREATRLEGAALWRRLVAWPSVQLRLDLDTRCNLRCEFCSTGHAGNVDRGAFPEDSFEKLSAELGKDVWSVFLSCAGEPLLDPRFERAMDSVRRNLSHCDVQIVSNATLLSESKARALLDGGLSRVFFSIDSIDPERYGRLRPGAAWETTRANLERFMRMKGSRRWPTVTVNTILMKENEHEIEAIADFCAGLGVDAFRVQHLETFADVPTDLEPARDTPGLRKRLLKLQLRLLRRGIVFDHPYALRWEKVVSALSTLRLHRDRWGYVKYLLGSVLGVVASPCRRIGWETMAYRDGEVHSCGGRADLPWNPDAEGFLDFLRASRRRHAKAPFASCLDCTYHRPEKRSKSAG